MPQNRKSLPVLQRRFHWWHGKFYSMQKIFNEALAIAKKRKMFVSESFLIGSAEDGKAVIIEKTPDSVGIV